MEYEKGYVYELMDRGGPTDTRQSYFREAVEEILREDVYYAGGMADYEVRSFKAAMISPSLADCAGK